MHILITRALASKANCKYIQPCYPLGENIMSHRVTLQQFADVLNHYTSQAFRKKIITRYYHDDLILEVCHDKHKCYVVYRGEYQYDEECGMEFVGEDRHDLSVTQFPHRKKYHHERQFLVLTFENIVLEVALIGIKSDRSMVGLVENILDEAEQDTSLLEQEDGESSDSQMLSYSLKIMVTDKDWVHRTFDIITKILSSLE
mgnify:CR=1 FL=1